MRIDYPRETALKILQDIEENKAYSNLSLDKFLRNGEGEDRLKAVDRAFITELVYGTIKWKLRLDYIIENFSTVRIKKISSWVLNILRLGLYQLYFMEKVPVSAAVNESVNLAKKYGHGAVAGFVNGLLRNAVRSRDSIKYPEKNSQSAQYLSVMYSHPMWMVQDWIKKYGTEFTESLLDANNRVPDFTVRANLLKASRAALMEELTNEGLEVMQGKYIDHAVIIKNPSSVRKIGAFNRGLFQVQDESSMLVGKVLDPQPGELVADVCAAPGGKSTHMAEMMGNKGTVISRDIHPHKIKLVEEAAVRLGIGIIKTEVYDATVFDDNLYEKADRVLIDAPCTGLGIIRRKPDIKWARNEGNLRQIVELQTKILDTCCRYVKPGGTLVYSTCTINEEENTGVVMKFLESHKEFTLEDFTHLLPQGLVESAGGWLQIYPNIHGIDGFFISRMRKATVG